MDKNRILIADDSAINREMLSEILGSSYDYVFASNGVEVIDILRGKDKIDLVLLDINMPIMDGFKVLEVMNERHWIEEFPVVVISADDSAEYTTKAYHLGAIDYINRPFRAIIVQRKVENTLLMYSNQKRLIELVDNQVQVNEKINNSLINIFSNVIELRNHESGMHTLNVQIITELLLNELAVLEPRYNLTKSNIALISSLSALHDIGKIKIPESVLNKPGKLNDEEWALMKTHTTEGEAILKASSHFHNDSFIHTACEICRWHHERYDGKGYPDGLVGDDIPISAQVVSLADVYDALTSERCYKKAYTHEVAVNMILNGECGTFNPLLIKCFLKIADKLKEVKGSPNPYDFHTSSAYITDELLKENGLPVTNSLRRMMDNERMKKDFFMTCAEGIQAEYDKLLKKVTFVYKSPEGTIEHRTFLTSRESKDNILPLKYWDMLRSALLKTNRSSPVTEMDVKLLIKGEMVPYHAKVMAIWPEDGSEYIFVMGHLTEIKNQ